jgi:hypothetical protein
MIEKIIVKKRKNNQFNYCDLGDKALDPHLEDNAGVLLAP